MVFEELLAGFKFAALYYLRLRSSVYTPRYAADVRASYGVRSIRCMCYQEATVWLLTTPVYYGYRSSRTVVRDVLVPLRPVLTRAVYRYHEQQSRLANYNIPGTRYIVCAILFLMIYVTYTVGKVIAPGSASGGGLRRRLQWLPWRGPICSTR